MRACARETGGTPGIVFRIRAECLHCSDGGVKGWLYDGRVYELEWLYSHGFGNGVFGIEKVIKIWRGYIYI